LQISKRAAPILKVEIFRAVPAFQKTDESKAAAGFFILSFTVG
jgi:hypothetical protein